MTTDPSSHNSLSRFQTVRYEPDGEFEASSAFATLLVGSVAGGICGFVASLCGYYGFYLILIMPALIGLGVGASMAKSVTFTNNRNQWVSAVAAGFASLVAIIVLHMSDYAFFQNDLEYVPAEDMQIAKAMKGYEQTGQTPPWQFQELLRNEEDPLYWKWLQVESFGEYLQMEAEVGISITKATMPADSGFNIGFTGTLLYWLFEALVIAGVATALVWKAASKPFCSECDHWYHEKKLGELTVNASQVASMLERGRIDGIQNELPGHELTRLTLYRCAACHSPDRGVVSVERVTHRNNNEQLDHKGSFVLPDEMIRQLSSLLSEVSDDLAVLLAVEELHDELLRMTTPQASAEPTQAFGEPGPNQEVEEYMERLLRQQAEQRSLHS